MIKKVCQLVWNATFCRSAAVSEFRHSQQQYVKNIKGKINNVVVVKLSHSCGQYIGKFKLNI